MNNQEQINEQKISKEQIIEQINSEVIPAEYHNWLECREKFSSLKDRINDFTLHGKGLYVHGEAGVGKTLLMYTVVGTIIQAKTLESQSSILLKNLCGISTSNALSIKVKHCYSSGTDIERVVKNLSDETYLFIDDLGAEKMTDNVYEVFYEILNNRYICHKPTFITSNLSLEEVATKIDSRIVSRIEGMCNVVELTGTDKRIK